MESCFSVLGHIYPETLLKKEIHCIQGFRNNYAQIRCCFWSVFPCIQTEYGDLFIPNTGKYGPEVTPYLDTFHAVLGK